MLNRYNTTSRTIPHQYLSMEPRQRLLMPPGHDYRSILTTRRITGSEAAIISLTRLNIIPFGIIQNTDGIHVFVVSLSNGYRWNLAGKKRLRLRHIRTIGFADLQLLSMEMTETGLEETGKSGVEETRKSIQHIKATKQLTSARRGAATTGSPRSA